jgi:hypothetical protein
MVDYTKPETGCVIEIYQLPPAKKMETLSSVKMTMESCLGTINFCLFWISLTMVTLRAECYCVTLGLRQPFFTKGLDMMTNTNHGRISTKRNSGQKRKLSERDRRTLKGIMSIYHKSTAAHMTAELHIHLEDCFHKNSLMRASQI